MKKATTKKATKKTAKTTKVKATKKTVKPVKKAAKKPTKVKRVKEQETFVPEVEATVAQTLSPVKAVVDNGGAVVMTPVESPDDVICTVQK